MSAQPLTALRRAGSAFVCMLLVVPAAAGQEPPVSPAERKIAYARRAIEEAPDRPDAHNELALALARRARETGNPRFYDEAERAAARSLELQPDNLEAQKLRIWVLLGRHEFARALELATALNRKVPDDVLVYGLLADAHAELGQYEQAEEAAQWMLDLRPGNIPGLTRAAYLRELFGDIEGALDLMGAAYERTPFGEVEDRAWILTHIAHLHLAIGQVGEADAALAHALPLFPRYHYTLAMLARVRTAQGKLPEGVDLLRQLHDVAPHPENLYLLAEALERAGQLREAELAYRKFEQQARAEMEGADNANRELILYYVDHAARPSEALRIAQLELERRQDVFTRTAYAWALSASGRLKEARDQIERVLAVGLRDPTVLYRAGVIAKRSGDRSAAERYLQQSLELAPASEVADAARRALER